jgi:hypothetical protein
LLLSALHGNGGAEAMQWWVHVIATGFGVAEGGGDEGAARWEAAGNGAAI